MKVKVTRRAERRIETVDRFWRENRFKAPELFKEELAAAVARLSEDSNAGKMLLERTEQWLYYVVRPKQEMVVVRMIWGARRGRDPKI